VSTPCGNVPLAPILNRPIGYLVDQDLIVKTDDDTFVLADSSEEHRAA
jgi:hypothetical protein